MVLPLPYMKQVSYSPPTCEVSSCLTWPLWSTHTLYGTGIWSLPHVKCLHVLYDLQSPHTLYGIGIIWYPTCPHGPPHVLWLMVPHTLYRIGILWLLPYLIWNHYHIVTLHVKCFHVLYDSYGLPYLIWNRYCMVPTCTYGLPPTCMYGPPHMYNTGILWSSHTCTHGPPHMWSVFMSYMTLMVPPYLIWNRYHMVPHMYVWSPFHVWYDVNDTYGPPIPYME